MFEQPPHTARHTDSLCFWTSWKFHVCHVMLSHAYLQVPSWLDVSNPRVTVVPHTSIFADAANQLPTFNTNAIEANIPNIPGAG